MPSRRSLPLRRLRSDIGCRERPSVFGGGDVTITSGTRRSASHHPLDGVPSQSMSPTAVAVNVLLSER